MIKLSNIYREWVSSIFGTVILILTVIYLLDNLHSLTFEKIAILFVLGAIGILFLFVRIDIIEKHLPKLK